MKKIKLPVQKSFEEIATEYQLKTKLIQDLTGLEAWDIEKAPTGIWELAEHLLDCGWKL